MTTHHLDTSRAAYHSVIPKLSERQAAVLEALAGSDPLTNSEIGEKLGWTINRVTPRVLELRELGQVRDAGKRRCRVTGRMAYAWVTGAPKPIAHARPKMVQRIVEVDGVRMMRWVPEA